MANDAIQPLAQRLTGPSRYRQCNNQQRQPHIEEPTLADAIGDQRQRRTDEYQGQLQLQADQSPPLPRLASRKRRTPSR
jgi:hypothetical protein